MFVRDICQRNVITGASDFSVRQAAQIMRDRNVGDLVITEKLGGLEKPIGIITDRDIVTLVIAQSADPDEISVVDIMKYHPVVVNENQSIQEVIKNMHHLGIRRIPVVDDRGFLAGIVSCDDVLLIMARDLQHLAGIVGQQIYNEQTGMTTGIERYV